jgi:hypothetical protein
MPLEFVIAGDSGSTSKSLRLIRINVKRRKQKYLSSVFQKYMFILSHPASAGGAYRDRHGRWKRDAVDARRLSALARRRKHPRGRPSRMVLSPRRWGQACETIFARRRWLTSPVHRGEYGAAVNTIAQGMPDCSALPVVTAACYFCCRRAMGAASIRHSLRPPLPSRATFGKTRADHAAGTLVHASQISLAPHATTTFCHERPPLQFLQRII